MVYVVLHINNPDSVYMTSISIIGVFETQEAMNNAISNYDQNKLVISHQQLVK